MSLLSGIIKDESPVPAKQLAYLINIIKELGWESLTDKRTIKPNVRRGQLYIRKHAIKLMELFGKEPKRLSTGISFYNLDRNKLIDMINPLLIEMWHIQIIGTSNAASLQFLIPKI